METWKLDRILSWLGSAIGHNKNKSLKFFYDQTDNIFFNLIEIDGQFSLWDKKDYSADSTDLLISKIIKIKNSDDSVLQIKKSVKIFEHLFNRSRNREEFKIKEEEWNNLFEEIKTFLQDNSIEVEKCKLVES